MDKYYISLNSISKVKHFVKDVSKMDATIDATNGSCTVDAKSILGIFSMNLLQPIQLIFHGTDTEIKNAMISLRNYKITPSENTTI